MLNRKLLEVLSCLTPAEKKRLRQFLESPYFNNAWNANDIVRLYDLVVRNNSDEKHPALSKEAVFRVFFPERQYQEKEKSPLDSLASDLFRLVRLFLNQQELEQKSSALSEHLALAKFYRKHAFEERFWQIIGTMRNLQNSATPRDARYFFNQFQIEEEELTFRGLYNSFEDDVNLNAVHENLDLYYSILKLEYTCALMYQKRGAHIEKLPSKLLMDDVMELTREGNALDVPINKISRIFVNLLQSTELRDDILVSLDNLLAQYQSQIPIDKFINFKAYLRFLWLQPYLKSGHGLSLRRIFDIYQEHLEQGYFYIDNRIPLTTFRNIVVTALTLNEFDWVKQFLDAHPPERICSTRYPAEVHSLNMAEYFFYLKKYDKAQEYLVYRLFENPTFSILADLLIVKIYYETQNDLLASRMKALEQKVRRSKLNQEIKNRYFNFLKKLDKIIKYGWQKRSPKREHLIAEIKTTPDIIAREWLLEKLS